MKTASLKIKRLNPVNGLDLYRDYTGDDLFQRYAPVGFYRNADTTYKGIVFRDANGNCTYFDRTHGMVYPFDREVWKHAMFNFIPDMESITVGVKNEKKSKKKIDVAAK